MVLVAAIIHGMVCGPAIAQPTTSGRIVIREVNGISKLFDPSTGKVFVPRGNNYVQIQPLRKNSDHTVLPYHSTFNRGAYDRVAAEKALKAMGRDGYNAVRVFLNATTEGGIAESEDALSKEYVGNFVDFLRLAERTGVVVLPTLGGLTIPHRDGVHGDQWCPDFQCEAAQILTQPGLRANKQFFVAFVRALKEENAPFAVLLGYELRNELTFDPGLPPLNLSDGSLRTANGKTYVLSDPGARERMLEEGLVYWANEVRKSILAEDPGALVGVGVVPPQEPHPIRVGDPRLSITQPLIESSELDFVDVHIYPEAHRLDMKAYAENFGFTRATRKVILLGEFGALFTMYPTVESASRAMVEWQRASEDFGVDGWLLWAWETRLVTETWNAVDSGGMMERTLSPSMRPRVSDLVPEGTIPDLPSIRVSASSAIQQAPPELAVDGTMAQYSAGAFAPQWIELQLNPPRKLVSVQLYVGQIPAGHTIHELLLKPQGGEFVKVHTFDGETKDYDCLEYWVRGPEVVEAIRVLTRESPSWVGWREIVVVPQATR